MKIQVGESETMEKVQNISDISKETLTFLSYFDKKLIEKIPNYIITKLCEEAADSKLNFYIDTSKSFVEQAISEKSKDLISFIYYDYIAEEQEKEEILKQWNLNEKNFQKDLREKYNIDNILKNKRRETFIENTNLPVEIKEESFLKKLVNFIKKNLKI